MFVSLKPICETRYKCHMWKCWYVYCNGTYIKGIN